MFDHFDDCMVLMLYCSFCNIVCGIKNIVFVFTYILSEYPPVYRNKDEIDATDLLRSKLQEIGTAYPDASLFLVGDINVRAKKYNDFNPQNDFATDV